MRPTVSLQLRTSIVTQGADVDFEACLANRILWDSVFVLCFATEVFWCTIPHVSGTAEGS